MGKEKSQDAAAIDDALEMRRKAAVDRIAAAEARRATAAKAKAESDVEALEREAAEAEAIADAESAHGPRGEGIAVVRYPGGIIIVRRPEYVLVQRFHDAGKFSTDAKDK